MNLEIQRWWYGEQICLWVSPKNNVESKRFGCLPHPFHLFPASPTHVWAVCQTSYPVTQTSNTPISNQQPSRFPRWWRTCETDQKNVTRRKIPNELFYVSDRGTRRKEIAQYCLWNSATAYYFAIMDSASSNKCIIRFYFFNLVIINNIIHAYIVWSSIYVSSLFHMKVEQPSAMASHNIVLFWMVVDSLNLEFLSIMCFCFIILIYIIALKLYLIHVNHDLKVEFR